MGEAILRSGANNAIDPWTGREYRASTGRAIDRLRLGIAVLVAAPSGALASYGYVEIVLWTQYQFGRRDLGAFWSWNALFALMIAVAEFSLRLRKNPRYRTSSHSHSAAARITVAFLISLATGAISGRWIPAWRFPVVYAWLVGGAVSLALSSLIYRRWTKAPPVEPRQSDRQC